MLHSIPCIQMIFFILLCINIFGSCRVQANVRFGPWPKVIGASALGYLVGKFSYMDECEERIMALPNSRLAQMLRSRSQKNNSYLDDDEIHATNATEVGLEKGTSLAPLRLDEFNQVNLLLFID